MAEELRSITDVATAFGIPVSTLRYYDEIGLVPASHRRSRVRHYDRASLLRLAYVQLWRLDGMLSIDHTSAILASEDRAHRNELLQRSRDELLDRIWRLQEAHDMLAHMMKCPHDDHTACPVVGTFLGDRVDAALANLGGDEKLGREPAGPALLRLVEELVGPVEDQDPPGHGSPVRAPAPAPAPEG
jgi:DNA-binding transcriptional MerR regulator